jgi:sugar/nucleoside kinase (ribokinase family)
MTSSFSLADPGLRQRELDVTGIENALLDLLVRVDDDAIEAIGLVKGTMRLVASDEQLKILARVHGYDPETEAGGSCANVLRTISRLGGRTCYSSAVARDDAGNAFLSGLADSKVVDRCVRLDHGSTGTSVILVTPDGERTMNTHLGVCREYAREHVPHDAIRASRIFFTTAYIWDTPNQIEAIEEALETARAAGCRLAIDLADPFAIERSRERILEHFARGFDLVFANAEEGRIMTGLGVEGAARKLAETIRVAVVTDGARGAFIVSGNEEIHVPARRVEVVDTTGAGDCFAAGFLYGLIRDQPLATCGEIATILAADTITHLGVKLSPDVEQRVEAATTQRVEARARA